MREIRKVDTWAQPIPAKKRVAAYARVTAGKEENLHSLSAQISYYSSYIQKHRGWEYVGVYADEALTGTKDARPEFQRLLSDCRNGKIDIVITKSISRFARNTVTMLETVRELKSLNIDVWFERENIHSLSGDGELMLTILASFAQEESRSTSENMKWRLRHNFKQGRASNVSMLGYRWVDGSLAVIPEEAEIVRMIFTYFLSGMGIRAIRNKLIEEGIPTKRGAVWRDNVIKKILKNEKYAGEMLLQKHYRADHISKKIHTNRGELPMYLVTDSHEPIIEKHIFEQVQEKLAEGSALYRKNGKAQAAYPYTGKIVCGICGKTYHRKHKYPDTKYENVVWVCSTKMKMGKAYCAAQQIPEHVLNEIDIDFEKIYVREPNTLVIVTPEGKEIVKQWTHKSRSEGWSDEMRQSARKKRLDYLERRKAECHRQQNQ